MVIHIFVCTVNALAVLWRLCTRKEYWKLCGMEVCVCVCMGLLFHFRLVGSLSVTRKCSAARHKWQWWVLWARNLEFSTLPNSPGYASLPLWQEDETSCQLKCDSLYFAFTHSSSHSRTHTFPLTSTSFGLFLCLESHFLICVIVSFVSFFLLICSFPLPIIYPLIWSSLLLVLYFFAFSSP